MRAIHHLSALSFGILALLVNQKPGMAHGKGMYTTKIEAQQRAAEIGCRRIHKNNGRWMPCTDERELHQQLRKQ
ncbi:gibberellin regulated protein [Synechococcus sp. MU1642]|uniref:gibberellin regulated protein n=1 Tax=Synechococcus sp. MU1642 TaxID=2508348 RepID=UPI001CF7F848|nr:gibberellin regulated protein [Synechococcus sp. MU1642]